MGLKFNQKVFDSSQNNYATIAPTSCLMVQLYGTYCPQPDKSADTFSYPASFKAPPGAKTASQQGRSFQIRSSLISLQPKLKVAIATGSYHLAGGQPKAVATGHIVSGESMIIIRGGPSLNKLSVFYPWPHSSCVSLSIQKRHPNADNLDNCALRCVNPQRLLWSLR